MPSYNSKDGVVTPAREKVSLVNETGKTITVNGKQIQPGEPYIYEGPDRAAVEYLKEQGVDHLGQHFTKDPEIIMRARQFNMTVDEFCQTAYYTDEMRARMQAEAASQTVLHRDLPRKSASQFRSGGANTAGSSGHYSGDFGDLSDAKAKIK